MLSARASSLTPPSPWLRLCCNALGISAPLPCSQKAFAPLHFGSRQLVPPRPAPPPPPPILTPTLMQQPRPRPLKALFVDAMGTLIHPSQPEAKMYREIGERYGVDYTEDEIYGRFDWAYAQPWDRTHLRYEGDARPFWRHMIEQSTGCNNPTYAEELYQYYTTPQAWHLAEPNLGKVFRTLREMGIKIAVVSNFDTRLRPLLRALQCDHWFDAIVVSAEVGVEKPNSEIFQTTCDLLGVQSTDVLHVGDGKLNDVGGARNAGCNALLWGEDVCSFSKVAQIIGGEGVLQLSHL